MSLKFPDVRMWKLAITVCWRQTMQAIVSTLIQVTTAMEVALWMKIWMASVTMSTHVLENLTPAASATVQERSTTADVQISRQEIATATATSLTPSASAVGLVRPMRTPMASATTSTHVLASSTLAVCATDQERSTSADALTSLKETATVTETSLTSAASAAETASLPETATVTATSLMPSENVEGLVRPMRTLMASATTSTHVLESLTPVACATDRARSTSADVQTSLKETATVTETSSTSAASAAETASLPGTATVMATSSMPLENAVGLVSPTRTPMASATTSTHVSENSMPVACATDQARSTSADALTSLKEIATVTATSLTNAAFAEEPISLVVRIRQHVTLIARQFVTTLRAFLPILRLANSALRATSLPTTRMVMVFVMPMKSRVALTQVLAIVDFLLTQTTIYVSMHQMLVSSVLQGL